MVNKGPYHAQGLFKLKRTQCLTRNVSVILECAFLIFGNVRRHKVVQCVEVRLIYGLFLQNNCEKKIQIKKKTQKYSHRGSNSGPLACEASVITN